jgi:hypothetical protein
MLAADVVDLSRRCRRVTAKDEGDPALLLLGAAVNPMGGYKEPWLPTDLQHEQGDKVVLREVSEFLGAFAYILWPFTARRLLASLPVASATDAFLTRCVASGTVRALVVQPALAVPRTDEYMPATRCALHGSERSPPTDALLRQH